jgi:hypothetical protein
MAFPTSPTNGQIYKNLEWNASRGCWVRAQVRTVRTAVAASHPGTQGQNIGASHVVFSSWATYKPTVLNLDNQSCWNNTTGVYTAKEEGAYLISWNGLIETTTSTLAYGVISFRKNGSDIMHTSSNHSTRAHSRHGISRSYEPLCGSIIVDLNVGDTLAVTCFTEGVGKIYASSFSGITVVKVGG